MAGEARKPVCRLGGVLIAANTATQWRFQTGTQPYQTIMSVHRSQWDSALAEKRGQPITLEIEDSRGQKVSVQNVYILHQVPSAGPNLVSFVVADKRWRWPYRLIARDYNVPKKTGDRTALNEVPVEQQITVDQYQYRAASLKGGTKRWTAKEAVEDVLKLLEVRDPDALAGGEAVGDGYKIESWPIEDGSEEDGQFALQNIMLRDQGDVALGRLLAYVPGADVWVDADGTTRVVDASDLKAVEEFVGTLPPPTWDGEAKAMIERRYIRPKDVFVYYQREVELLLEFSDDYSGNTSADPGRDTPYIENVLPTVDPKTTLFEYDPELNQSVPKRDVPPGTWVEVRQWLDAMNAVRPEGSLPLTFETIKRHWLKGDLDGVLGGRELDLETTGVVALRVQALKQHFRQTFRMSRRYVERLRDIQPVRAGLLDPVTGARAPAAVWGQACIVPSEKGKRMSVRKTDDQQTEVDGVFRNVDYLRPSKEGGKNIIETAPGPTRVVMIDQDLGIFRLEWLLSPYGIVESFVPCNMVGVDGQPATPTRDLSKQDDKPMGAGFQIESGTNGLFLAPRLEYKVLLTVVPAAPNNVRQFHRKRVTSTDVKDIFRDEFRIQGGVGPPLHVFIAPGELSARFAWTDDDVARATLAKLLGLDSDDLEQAGIDTEELPGFTLNNGATEIKAHAQAVAAEMLVPFADNIMGRVAGVMPREMKLVGNMASATINVSAAPSGKVSALHEFPGQQKMVSRMAMLPESARHLILGILKVGV